MSQLKTKSITAQNTFTDPFAAPYSHDIAVSVSGTFGATVTPQRSIDDGETWADLDTTYTAAAEFNIVPTDGCLYRVGVKTGDFTSGTVVVGIRA